LVGPLVETASGALALPAAVGVATTAGVRSRVGARVRTIGIGDELIAACGGRFWLAPTAAAATKTPVAPTAAAR
jgi:hypothetical protein